MGLPRRRVADALRLPPPFPAQAHRRPHVVEAGRPALSRAEGAARLGLAHSRTKKGVRWCSSWLLAISALAAVEIIIHE